MFKEIGHWKSIATNARNFTHIHTTNSQQWAAINYILLCQIWSRKVGRLWMPLRKKNRFSCSSFLSWPVKVAVNFIRANKILRKPALTRWIPQWTYIQKGIRVTLWSKRTYYNFDRAPDWLNWITGCVCIDYEVSAVPPQHLAILGMDLAVQSVVDCEMTVTWSLQLARHETVGTHKPLSHNVGGHNTHVTGWQYVQGYVVHSIVL